MMNVGFRGMIYRHPLIDGLDPNGRLPIKTDGSQKVKDEGFC